MTSTRRARFTVTFADGNEVAYNDSYSHGYERGGVLVITGPGIVKEYSPSAWREVSSPVQPVPSIQPTNQMVSGFCLPPEL